jgi:hypothetical protein
LQKGPPWPCNVESIDLEEALKREIFEGTAGSWPVSEPAGQPSPAQLSSARM